MLVGGAVFGLAYICLAAPRGLDRVAPIWLPNALLLALLRLSPVRRWGALSAIAWVGNAIANLAAGDPAPLGLGLALCNVLEVLGAAAALRRPRGSSLDIMRVRDGLRYAAVTVAAAGAGAALAALMLHIAGAPPRFAGAMTWAIADFAGLFIVAPCLVVLLSASEPLRRLKERPLWPFALLLAATLLAFLQNQFALAYLVLGALLLVTWLTGLIGAAVGILLTLGLAAGATMAGLGPFAMGGGSVVKQVVLLQLFLGVCFSLSLPVAVQRRRARRLADALAQALEVSRDAEERYRLIADRSHDIIVRADCDGTLLYVSPACRTYGYEPEDLIGRHADEFLHPDDVAHHNENMRLLFAGQIPPASERQHRFRSHNGAYGWLEGNPVLIPGRDGRPVEILNVFRDVSEHKALEAALSHAREEAEAAAQAKSEFLANMSHELRTPLTSVIGFTRLALERPALDDLSRTYVQRVNDASQALLSTVNDILDFSKLEAGQVTFHPRPTPLLALLRASLSLFEPQATAKSISLGLETDINGELMLLADPDRLRQVLLNLLGNAVKFTAAGGVTLRAGYAAGAGVLRVEVVDTGPGISEEDRARLFRRFSQIDGSLARSHGGTGLGLAICKGIVEALGGHISVRSRLGQGSAFCFEVPLDQAAAPAEGPEAARPSIAAGLRVLVVDDHAINRELVGLLLAGVAAQVSDAGGGEEAIEMAELWPYDVILMDLRMPGLDGETALRRIRASLGPNARTPVLAFTADATPELEARLFDRGFQGMVGKPVAPDALLSAIARACPEHEETADSRQVG
ncbi:ATP-binding protein [Phenylobacterium sp.]|uniref:ATP-binding protein n=1 Tax=Phenylobacterium sp. TaxID=1871053 RepID=UPI002CE22143|nr:ATP-binding protein [Phenylobacterium sp.]HVI31041.1 ATP-binding protein [Phenylobacterium sp.]